MAKGKPRKRTTAKQIDLENELQIKRTHARHKIPKSDFIKPPVKESKKAPTSRRLKAIDYTKKKGTTPKESQPIKEAKQSKKVQQKEYRRMPTKAKKPEPQYIPRQSTIVLDNIRDMIANWEPQSNWSPYFSEVKRKDKNILSNILEGAINSEGDHEVARRLERYAIEVMDIVNRTLYESGGKTGRDQVQIDLQRFSAIIMGRGLSVDESKEITESIEQMDYYNDNE